MGNETQVMPSQESVVRYLKYKMGYTRVPLQCGSCKYAEQGLKGHTLGCRRNPTCVFPVEPGHGCKEGDVQQ